MATISSSIANSLGIGSGIDSAGVVQSLVAAVRDPREGAITQRQSLNNARISALASATSSLSTFSKALTDLLSGTGFSGEPGSSDPTVASVSLLPGGVPSGLPATIKVQQLAAAQTLYSKTFAAKTSVVGAGSLNFTVNGVSTTVTTTDSATTLDGLAAAINAKGAGVTALVVTDQTGAKLVLKGETGAANAFTVTADSAYADFAYDGAAGTLSKTTSAADSIVTLDGVQMTNSGNTIDTAIPFLRIDLNKAAPTTEVTLASSEPTTTMRDLVTEFVEAYNSLKGALNGATAAGSEASGAGPLAGDAGTRDMVRQLSRLPSTQLASTGPYRTLSDLGVSTNRDGTLKLDTKKLDAAIAADAAAVTQMLNPAVSTDSDPGLAGAMKKVTDALQADNGALASSKARYEKMKESLDEQLEKLDRDMDNYEQRTAAVFAAMDTQLAALKATQSYMTQQIAMWSNSDS